MGIWVTVVAVLVCTGFAWQLGTRAETAGPGEGHTARKLTLGQGLINLGQRWGSRSPLMHTKANLADISTARSKFQFRTFDPEGLLFYGDTRDGADWFVLALRDGFLEIQIGKAGVQGMVSGGPRLNDGLWHKVEVKSEGRFVVLKVNETVALMVGLDSPETAVQEGLAGPIRLSLGGMLKQQQDLFQPLGLDMDACIREGSWLNMTIFWESETDSDHQSCLPSIQRGSYFSGKGLAVFKTSDSPFHPLPPFPSQKTADGEIFVKIQGNIEYWNGTFLNIQTQSHKSEITITAKNETKELTMKVGTDVQTTPLAPGKNYLDLILSNQQIHIHYGPTKIQFTLEEPQQWQSEWNQGLFLTFGGVPDVSYRSGSDYLHGCIEQIKVQNQDMDLDRAFFKHSSITSHSCPKSYEEILASPPEGINIFGSK